MSRVSDLAGCCKDKARAFVSGLLRLWPATHLLPHATPVVVLGDGELCLLVNEEALQDVEGVRVQAKLAVHPD